jgi:hypothetical protein
VRAVHVDADGLPILAIQTILFHHAIIFKPRYLVQGARGLQFLIIVCYGMDVLPQKFNTMAEQDKVRYENELREYVPADPLTLSNRCKYYRKRYRGVRLVSRLLSCKLHLGVGRPVLATEAGPIRSLVDLASCVLLLAGSPASKLAATTHALTVFPAVIPIE